MCGNNMSASLPAARKATAAVSGGGRSTGGPARPGDFAGTLRPDGRRRHGRRVPGPGRVGRALGWRRGPGVSPSPAAFPGRDTPAPALSPSPPHCGTRGPGRGPRRTDPRWCTGAPTRGGLGAGFRLVCGRGRLGLLTLQSRPKVEEFGDFVSYKSRGAVFFRKDLKLVFTSGSWLL